MNEPTRSRYPRRRKRRLTIRGLERLLWALVLMGGAAVAGNEVFKATTAEPALEKPGGTEEAGPGKPDNLASQLAQAIEQLKASQDRVGQLEAELTRTRAELDVTRTEAGKLRLSTASAKRPEQPMSEATGSSATAEEAGVVRKRKKDAGSAIGVSRSRVGPTDAGTGD